jgi:hypothetical protein
LNAPAPPEVLAKPDVGLQAEPPAAAEGALRYVWESRFGPMLIEVRAGRAYVNGQPVEPSEPEIPGSQSVAALSR